MQGEQLIQLFPLPIVNTDTPYMSSTESRRQDNIRIPGPFALQPYTSLWAPAPSYTVLVNLLLNAWSGLPRGASLVVNLTHSGISLKWGSKCPWNEVGWELALVSLMLLLTCIVQLRTSYTVRSDAGCMKCTDRFQSSVATQQARRSKNLLIWPSSTN